MSTFCINEDFLAVDDAVSILHDKRLSCLTKDFCQASLWNLIAFENLLEEATSFYRGKLLGISDEDDVACHWYCFEKSSCQLDVDHAGLINDDEVGHQLEVLIVHESAVGIVAQQPMDCLRFSSGSL